MHRFTVVNSRRVETDMRKLHPEGVRGIMRTPDGSGLIAKASGLTEFEKSSSGGMVEVDQGYIHNEKEPLCFMSVDGKMFCNPNKKFAQ